MKSQLLVEGKYDGKLIDTIALRVGIDLTSRYEIVGCGGLPAMLDRLRVIDTRAAVLAMICDADEDAGDRWGQVKAACREGGLELGDASLSAHGFVWNLERQQKFACWMMPDNQSRGSIEGRLIDGHRDPVQQGLHEQAMRFVEAAEPRLFPQTVAATQKAGLRAWFAVQEEPVWLPSFAVEHQLLLPQLDRDDHFAQWLGRVYELAG